MSEFSMFYKKFGCIHASILHVYLQVSLGFTKASQRCFSTLCDKEFQSFLTNTVIPLFVLLRILSKLLSACTPSWKLPRLIFRPISAYIKVNEYIELFFELFFLFPSVQLQWQFFLKFYYQWIDLDAWNEKSPRGLQLKATFRIVNVRHSEPKLSPEIHFLWPRDHNKMS